MTVTHGRRGIGVLTPRPDMLPDQQAAYDVWKENTSTAKYAG